MIDIKDVLAAVVDQAAISDEHDSSLQDRLAQADIQNDPEALAVIASLSAELASYPPVSGNPERIAGRAFVVGLTAGVRAASAKEQP